MIRSLQAFRAVAAMLVMTQHLNIVLLKYFEGTISNATLMPIGRAGVQFFFVLSGFIICHVHRHEILNRSVIPLYFARRSMRILPLYWIVTLAMVPAWLLVPSFGEEYHRSFPALLSSLFLVPQPHYPHLAVGWTLLHEGLFYAFFALFFLTPHFHRIAMAWATAIIIHWFLPAGNWLLDFYLAPLNLLFLAGLAISVNLSWIKSHLSGAALFATGLFGFLAGGALALRGVNEIYTSLIFAISSISLVMASANGGIESLFRRQRVLVFLGAASYSIYLIHYPVMSVLSKGLKHFDQWALPMPFVVAGLFLVPLSAGILLHLLVEKPLLVAAGRHLRMKTKKVRPRSSSKALRLERSLHESPVKPVILTRSEPAPQKIRK